MDFFSYMVDSLSNPSPSEVNSLATPTRKRVPRKYVISYVKAYDVRLSSLSYYILEKRLSGVSFEAIGLELGMQENSVRDHQDNLARKMGLPSKELLSYLKKWKEENAAVKLPVPSVSVNETHEVDGVMLNTRQYSILKDLIELGVETAAKKHSMKADSMASAKRDLCVKFGSSWDEVTARVRRFTSTA